MRFSNSWRSHTVSVVIVAAAAAAIAWTNRHSPGADGGSPRAEAHEPAAVTSRDGLQDRRNQMERRLRERPTDAEAAEALADALMRQARVSGNSGLALRAEQALEAVLHDDPASYGARRMLGAVYLSQHRFRDAIREAETVQRERPTDDWNYGVIGDAHLELGEYDEAFAAFQRMMDLRPTAGAYARAAYALELRGHLEAAVRAMKMATDATPPSDYESMAWHHAQLGDLYRQLGKNTDAEFEYEWADHLFPKHPFAERGMAEVLEANGDLHGALARFEALMARSPSPDVTARIGDLYSALGRAADAARAYALAEADWRSDSPNPSRLAGFLADHEWRLPEAVLMAEGAAADRHDIFTEDALAWCYFKSGRLQEAAAAIAQAQRTGTRDRAILYHAAAITQGRGDSSGARRLARAALDGNPRFDVRLSPAARVLAGY